MKWNTKKIIQIAFGLVVVAIIGNVLLYMFNLSPFNLAVIDQSRSVSAANVTDIHVNSNTANVNIVPYDGTEIQVHMKGKSEERWADDFQLSVEENGNQVTIEANELEKTRIFVLYSGDYELLVQLPQKNFERLQVQTEAADIDVEGVQIKRSFLEAGVGNITSKQLQGIINGVTGAGDIYVQLQSVENDIEAKTSVGNITVTTEIAPEAIQTELRNGLGERTIDFPGLPNAEDGSVGTGGPNVKLSAEVGDLALLMADH
ncbi:DUF4097 family beta strand repeat-containing protein [Paenibacillus sp. IHBB 10380]|uniref:DUF4097 family beta strand repeat-containing protein n=1 Tax=Paenibacillus sp. IHBB 10380 TaxID=1566358 RepID=UPI0005CFD3DF|nr:DUF4097 family beta strand repeat-containing protein [Paenibacillus sp. IHBB 10380]AJS58446.1 hypothetical protein UB51_07965 [Paenibacillus sp. IHBB 10380]